MAVKAVAIIAGVWAYAGGTWRAQIQFAPLVEYTDGTDIYAYGLSGDILSTTLSTAIKDAVKTEMEAHGVTFGVLDTVRVLPGGL